MTQNNGQTVGGVTGRGFRPGESGNPGGRPRGLARVTREVVGDDGEAIAHFWLEVMNDRDQKMRDRLDASRLLAERGWGKPTLVVDTAPDEPANDERLQEAARGLREELERLHHSAIRSDVG
jgi:hypothetical protein